MDKYREKLKANMDFLKASFGKDYPAVIAYNEMMAVYDADEYKADRLAGAQKEMFNHAEVCVLVMGTECKGDEISDELYKQCRLSIAQKMSSILDSYPRLELDMEIRKLEAARAIREAKGKVD